jgi:hypothetical protein
MTRSCAEYTAECKSITNDMTPLCAEYTAECKSITNDMTPLCAEYTAECKSITNDMTPLCAEYTAELYYKNKTEPPYSRICTAAKKCALKRLLEKWHCPKQNCADRIGTAFLIMNFRKAFLFLNALAFSLGAAADSVSDSVSDSASSSDKLRGKKQCKRQSTKAKNTESCNSENLYNGLQDTLAIPMPADPTRCLAALEISQFDLLDLDNYGRWMDESTVMQVADTGKFLGPEGIEEYVKIALAPDEEYFFKGIEQFLETTRVLPITVEGNECVVLISYKIAMSTYQVNTPVDLITGSRFTFTLLDDSPFPSEILMRRIDIVSTSNAS